MDRSMIIVRFNPRYPNDWDNKTIELCTNKKLFVFKFAYTTANGEIFYETIDPQWPHVGVISALDLKLLNL